MKNLFVAPVLVLASISCASAQTVKPFASFETEDEIKGARLNHATASLVETNVSDGKKALGITFQPPAMYPSYNFPIPTPLDWTGSGALAFEVSNPGTEPISFAIRIDTALNSDGKNNSRTGSGRVNAGQTITYLMPFNVEVESPDMSKLAGYTTMRNTTGGWSPFNVQNIVAMQIFSVKPTADRTLIFDNMRLVPALPPIPPPPLKTDTREILNFETEAEAQNNKPNSASASWVTKDPLTGKGSLKMKFDPPATYPNVGFPFATPQDMRGYGGIAFDLYNPNEESVRFFARIDSTTSAGGSSEGSRSGSSSLEAGQRASFVLPFGVDASALGMKALPGFGSFRSMGAGGSGVFDLSKIATWQIFLVRPSASTELVLDNVRLVPGQKQDFNKIIDRYGQYTRADWMGKVKTNADFATQIAQEDTDLKKITALTDRNQYGGWSKGPQLKATGFFRTEKYNGKWSFVDPEGRLFLSFGPDTISTAAGTALTAREYMFETLPKNDALLTKYTSAKGELDLLGANLERKYGADYKKAFLDRTYDRLRSWGFNTIGAFSSWDTFNNGKVPYTATVWPSSGHARVATGNDVWRTMDDPFDPKFAVDVASAARSMATRIKDDPYFIGYFVGNEESWGYYRSGARSQYGLILGALKAKAENSPAKRTFLAQLQAKYGDVAKLNAAWGTTYADWNAMNESLSIKDPLSDAMLADFSSLLKSYAEQYFRTVQAELKKVDPNHVYLGCRFAGYSPEILEAAAKYTDVMSFNIYRISIDPKEFKILDAYDHPVLVGEFHFGATDRGMFDIGLVGVTDQKARGRAYQKYINSVLDNPMFVGAHWFQYTDQPTTGRTQDGENANVGFVSITDTPYPELIAAAREAHAQMYTRRFGK